MILLLYQLSYTATKTTKGTRDVREGERACQPEDEASPR